MPESLGGQGGERRAEFDAGEPAAEGDGGQAGGSGAAERVEHQAAGRAAGGDGARREVDGEVLCVMQYVPDSAGPHQIVSRLMDAVPAGSYLTMSDTTTDINPEQVLDGTARLNARMGSARFTPRTGEQIARFFDGLDLVEPGLVPLPQWRSHDDGGQVISVYGCVGQKR
jgi:S-adenosyl methyltransferase